MLWAIGAQVCVCVWGPPFQTWLFLSIFARWEKPTTFFLSYFSTLSLLLSFFSQNVRDSSQYLLHHPLHFVTNNWNFFYITILLLRTIWWNSFSTIILQNFSNTFTVVTPKLAVFLCLDILWQELAATVIAVKNNQDSVWYSFVCFREVFSPQGMCILFKDIYRGFI